MTRDEIHEELDTIEDPSTDTGIALENAIDVIKRIVREGVTD